MYLVVLKVPKRPRLLSAMVASRFGVLGVALVASLVSCVDIGCQIFDNTMVCDNEKQRLHRGEIRTCSG